MGHRFFLHRGIYDEGLVIYGATRILNGDIPYRDFWTLYAPATFYLLAGVFKIFGTSIIVERILSVIIHTLIVIPVCFIIKSFVPKRYILLAWLLTLAWLRTMLFYSYGYSYAVLPATLFVLLSCLTLKHYFLMRRRKWLIISGVFVGIVALFRQDFGFYTFISEYLVIFIFIYNNLDKKAKVKTLVAIRESLFYLFGNFIIIFPIIFYFIFNSAIFSLFRNAIIFPLTVYPKVRAIPFPKLSLASTIFYFPIFVFIITLAILIRDSFSKIFSQGNRYLMILFLFLGFTFLNYPFMRAHIRYLLPCELFAIILFIFLSYIFTQKIFFKQSIFYRFSVYNLVLVVTIFLFIFPAILETKQYIISRKKFITSKLSLNRNRGCYDWEENILYQQDAIKYIQQYVEPEKHIFIGNLRHDRVVYNDIMFYFLSERHSATKYYELHPGLTTTEEIQKKIIDEIKKHNVRYIVLWGGSETVIEPNQSNKSSGVFLLDNFIHKKYKIEKTFGKYLILRHI